MSVLTDILGMIGGVRPDGTAWQGLNSDGLAHAADPNYTDYSQLFREYRFDPPDESWMAVGERDGQTVYAAPDYARDENGAYINVSAASARDMANSRGSLIPTRDEYTTLFNQGQRLTMPTFPNGVGDRTEYTRLVDERRAGLDAGLPIVHGKEFFSPNGGIPEGGVVQQLYDGMIARGFPEHIAKGFLVNFQDESGFDLTIEEHEPNVHGTRGIGLYQATGPRRTELEEFAAARGVGLDDIDMNLDNLVRELDTTESAAKKAIWNTNTWQEAADQVLRTFLRPAAEHVNSRSAAYLGSTEFLLNQPERTGSNRLAFDNKQRAELDAESQAIKDGLLPALTLSDAPMTVGDYVLSQVLKQDPAINPPKRGKAPQRPERGPTMNAANLRRVSTSGSGGNSAGGGRPTPSMAGYATSNNQALRFNPATTRAFTDADPAFLHDNQVELAFGMEGMDISKGVVGMLSTMVDPANYDLGEEDIPATIPQAVEAVSTRGTPANPYSIEDQKRKINRTNMTADILELLSVGLGQMGSGQAVNLGPTLRVQKERLERYEAQEDDLLAPANRQKLYDFLAQSGSGELIEMAKHGGKQGRAVALEAAMQNVLTSSASKRQAVNDERALRWAAEALGPDVAANAASDPEFMNEVRKKWYDAQLEGNAWTSSQNNQLADRFRKIGRPEIAKRLENGGQAEYNEAIEKIWDLEDEYNSRDRLDKMSNEDLRQAAVDAGVSNTLIEGSYGDGSDVNRPQLVEAIKEREEFNRNRAAVEDRRSQLDDSYYGMVANADRSDPIVPLYNMMMGENWTPEDVAAFEQEVLNRDDTLTFSPIERRIIAEELGYEKGTPQYKMITEGSSADVRGYVDRLTEQQALDAQRAEEEAAAAEVKAQTQRAVNTVAEEYERLFKRPKQKVLDLLADVDDKESMDEAMETLDERLGLNDALKDALIMSSDTPEGAAMRDNALLQRGGGPIVEARNRAAENRQTIIQEYSNTLTKQTKLVDAMNQLKQLVTAEGIDPEEGGLFGPLRGTIRGAFADIFGEAEADKIMKADQANILRLLEATAGEFFSEFRAVGSGAQSDFEGQKYLEAMPLATDPNLRAALMAQRITTMHQRNQAAASAMAEWYADVLTDPDLDAGEQMRKLESQDGLGDLIEQAMAEQPSVLETFEIPVVAGEGISSDIVSSEEDVARFVEGVDKMVKSGRIKEDTLVRIYNEHMGEGELVFARDIIATANQLRTE